MESSIIRFKHWKTEKEQTYLLAHFSGSIERKTGLICPFDQVEIVDREYYHNEHDTFCPGCEMSYSSKNVPQERINKEAVENVRRYQEALIENEKEIKKRQEKKADLEARITHAKEVGLIPK